MGNKVCNPPDNPQHKMNPSFTLNGASLNPAQLHQSESGYSQAETILNLLQPQKQQKKNYAQNQPKLYGSQNGMMGSLSTSTWKVQQNNRKSSPTSRKSQNSSSRSPSPENCLRNTETRIIKSVANDGG